MRTWILGAALCVVSTACIEPQQAILSVDTAVDAQATDGVTPDVDPDDTTDPGLDTRADTESDTTVTPDTSPSDVTPPSDTTVPDAETEDDTSPLTRYVLSTREATQTFFPGRQLRQPFFATVYRVEDGGTQSEVGAGLGMAFQIHDEAQNTWITLRDDLVTQEEGWAQSDYWEGLESTTPVRFRLVVAETLARATPDAIEFIAVPTEMRFFVTGATHSCAATHNELFCWGYNGPPTENAAVGAGPRPMTANTYVPSEPLHNGQGRVDWPRLIPLPGSTSEIYYTLPEGAEILGIAVAGTTTQTQPVGAATCLSIGAPQNLQLNGVWCVGSNLDSRLGNNNVAQQSSEWTRVRRTDDAGERVPLEPVIGLAGGANHFCAYRVVNNESDVFCWGSNEFGQLGHPSTVQPLMAIKVNFNGAVDDTQKLLPDRLVVGDRNTCLRLTEPTEPGTPDAATVLTACWGANDAGQLTNVRLEGDAPPTLYQTEQLCGSDFVSGRAIVTHGARDIAVGRQHICAVAQISRNAGVTEQQAKDACGLTTLAPRAVCSGANAQGQRGVVASNGDFAAWAQLAEPPPFNPVEFYVGMAAGDDFTCGWTTTKSAFCWGDSRAGQLGPMPNETVAAASRVTFDPDLDLSVSRIAAGPRHACAVTYVSGEDPTRTTIYCWGDNTFGQSGVSCEHTPTAASCDGKTPRPIILY